MATINVGYSKSKHGYRAVAFVADKGVYHTRRTGLGDSARDAQNEAIEYIRETYVREGLPFPEGLPVQHGRMRADYVDQIFGLMAGGA